MLCVIDLECSCVPEGLFDFRSALVDFLILLDKFNDIGNTLTCLNKSFNAAVEKSKAGCCRGTAVLQSWRARTVKLM